jgi:hypothetical protein
MKHRIGMAILFVGLAAVLGATVFRDQVAWAAQSVDAHITNVDDNGNVKVHEQGTVSVNVANSSVPTHEQGTANVSVTNASLPVAEAGEPLTIEFPAQGNHYTVPSGKRLVIEYVNGFTNTGQMTRVNVVTSASVTHQFLIPGVVCDTTFVCVSEKVWIPLSAGDSVLWSGFGDITVTGQLVDA